MKKIKYLLTCSAFIFSSLLAVSQNWSLTGNSGTGYTTDFIGTTDSKPIRFRTNNIERMIVDSLGNLGIGLSSPTEKLHVDGKIRFGSTSKVTVDATTDGANTNVSFNNAQYGSAFVNASRFGGTTYSTTDQYIDLSNNGIRIKSYTAYSTEGALDINTASDITTAGWKLLTVKNQNVLKSYIDKDGGAWFNSSVGIGTTSTADTNYRLFVFKGVRTRKVKVDQSTWADYVFQSGYKLRPLQDLEKFIKENNHLPEVPSTKEIEENGLDLGDNQVLLLKKIEELTLYVIEQNNKLMELQKEVATLKKQ